MLPHLQGRIRRLHLLAVRVLIIPLLLQVPPGFALEGDADELVDVSYIYGVILGTGTYTLRGTRITMLKLPFSGMLREATADTAGWRWTAPTVLGYDDLTSVDSDIIERLLPDQLVTLSVMPGIEYAFPFRRWWYLKPFAELGGGRDFSAKETFALVHLGLRSLNVFEPAGNWALRVGSAVRWAGEYQFDSVSHGFGIVDLALDVRRSLPWRLFGQPLDAGTYYIYERYLPRWTLGEAEDWRSRSRELHEFGLSIGIQEGRKILGFNVKRVRIGYKKGEKLRGWTIGTEFPF